MVRVATSTDIAEIVRLTNLAFRVEDFFIDGDRTDATDVAGKMVGDNACFLVIEDEICRVLLASAYVEIRGPRGYFAMLAVDPARQKTGLGRRLLDAIEAHCRAAGCSAIEHHRRELADRTAALLHKARIRDHRHGAADYTRPQTRRATSS